MLFVNRRCTGNGVARSVGDLLARGAAAEYPEGHCHSACRRVKRLRCPVRSNRRRPATLLLLERDRLCDERGLMVDPLKLFWVITNSTYLGTSRDAFCKFYRFSLSRRAFRERSKVIKERGPRGLFFETRGNSSIRKLGDFGCLAGCRPRESRARHRGSLRPCPNR